MGRALDRSCTIVRIARRPLISTCFLAGLCFGCGSNESDASGERHDAAVVEDGGQDAFAPDGGKDAAGTDAAHGIPAPGTAIEDGAACDAGPLDGAACKHLIVKCPGVAELGVTVRSAKPTALVRATILLGSGGSGTAFLEDEPLALALETELLANGFVVVSRKWDDPGWFGGSLGLTASSCRYATLLRWVDENLRATSAPYCALGISGGSYEVGYALARWDAADRLKGAMLLAGPAVSKLEWVCPSVAPANWTGADCAAMASKYGVSCASSSLYCTLTVQGAAAVVDSAWSPNHPCTDSSDPKAPQLAADGIVTKNSRYDYPNTSVRFVSGADECGVQALLYYAAITSDRGIAFPLATPHDVLSTDQGLAATKTAIQEACAPY